MKSLYFKKDIPRILLTKFNAKHAKALLFTSLNPVRFDKNLPDCRLPAPNWVKVRNIQTGVCGTDLSFFKCTTGTSIALEPMPGSDITYLGHETVGIVQEVGPAVKSFKVGDRVTLMKYMSCCTNKAIEDECDACKEGNYCLCSNYGESSPLNLGFTGAGFGDYYLAPEGQITKVHDSLSDDEATLIEVFSVALHSVLLRQPKENDKVLIIGCGPIGLAIVEAVKALCPTCKLYVLDHNSFKTDFAQKLGADGVIKGENYEAVAKVTGAKLYNGMFGNRNLSGGFDIIYDCVGTSWAIHNGLRWLKARGCFVKVGHHMCSTKFDETPLWWQELTVIGVDAHGMEHYQGQDIYTFELVQRFMEEGRFNIDGFITQRMSLENYKDAFRLMINHKEPVIKIVLDCQHQ